ncbi:MAG TPA: hypothetical protein VHL11_00580, partial [Phototrophicaceae bacterium]|nr:hypothetical protein [Phototrophicaceae bacterium]
MAKLDTMGKNRRAIEPSLQGGFRYCKQADTRIALKQIEVFSTQLRKVIPMNILLLDDNPHRITFFQNGLKKHKLTVCRHARAAIKALKK